MLKKYFSRGRRQETGDRRQETGGRRNGSEDRRQEKWIGSEEVGAKFCSKIVLPNYAPKIRSMHEREELKQAHFFRSQKGTCLYMSMLLYLISKP
ncbi:MAG: hypothetical protein F6K18_09660 [Okeania sp. SIO2C2]|uniref:hypothetical protein n=1 Tax=Okeania sp. SIO2C2 TaxID=2607787 RepID=UPI0013B8D38D|nr:hypothetical protein [Okeania sp. SIO2C2]NEP87076.1 hypothetical protein [Okeania sp. SIO2C2]